MSTSKTWPGGATGATPTAYTIPAAGELNWASLSNFLNALGDGAQCTTFQKFAVRKATTTPVSVATSDCIVVSDLSVAGTVAVTLPVGANKQVFFIVDGKGDANTNNITITPNGSETIAGSATLVLSGAREGVCLVYNLSDTDWKIINRFNRAGSGIGGFTASRAIVSDGSGNLSSATTTSTEIGYVNGVTSAIQTQIDAKQPLDTDLTALAGLSSNGMIARTGSGTASVRTLTAGSTKLAVTNGDGVSGNPTVDVTEANLTISNMAGTLAINHGGTNSTTALNNNRVMQSSGGAIVEAAAISASKALVSDANGIPVAATPSTTQINYLSSTGSAVAGISDTAQFTNKDYDGGTASNSLRLTVPKNTLANLTALTRKEATIVYGTDTDQLYADDGTSLNPIGSGAGEKNYIAGGSNNATGWTASGVGVTVATTVTAAELPRENTTRSGIKITGVSGSTAYAYYRFTLDDVDLERVLKIKIDLKPVSGYVASDMKIDMYSNTASDYSGTSTRIVTSSDSSAICAIPNLTGQFQTTVDMPGSTAPYMELRIGLNAASTQAIVVSDVVVGPGIQPQGAVIQDWITFTPTGAWSSNTTYSGKYRRIGDSMDLEIKLALAGAPTSATLTVNMPTGFTIDTTKLTDTTAPAMFSGFVDILDSGTATFVGVTGYNNTTSIAVYYTDDAAGGVSAIAVTQAAPMTFANNDKIVMRIHGLPIAEWSGSGVVNIAQNDVEYASNSSTTDAADTTSFVYGPSGSLVPTITASAVSTSRDKRVRFQTPIQPGDMIRMEMQFAGAGPWIPLGADPGYMIYARLGGTSYGIGLLYANSTDVDVLFCQGGRVASNATFALAGANYPRNAADRWRLVKSKQGQAIGFSKTDSTSLGLTTSYAPVVKSSIKTFTNAGYTITESDGYDLFLGNTASGIATLTLPAASSSTGRRITVKKTSASNSIVIDTPSTETIDGSAQNHLYANYAFATYECDGTNWHVIDVWDYVTSSVTGQAASASAAVNNATNVLTGEGMWTVAGTIQLVTGATFTTVTVLEAGFSTAAGSYDSTSSGGYVRIPLVGGITGANATLSVAVPNRVFTNTSTQTVQFNEMVTYSAISATFNLNISATRIR